MKQKIINKLIKEIEETIIRLEINIGFLHKQKILQAHSAQLLEEIAKQIAVNQAKLKSNQEFLEYLQELSENNKNKSTSGKKK